MKWIIYGWSTLLFTNTDKTISFINTCVVGHHSPPTVTRLWYKIMGCNPNRNFSY